MQPYWFIVGERLEASDPSYYVMTVANTPEYAYYQVVNVSIPDDRAVSEAIYEAEGRIDTIENALNWDD